MVLIKLFIQMHHESWFHPFFQNVAWHEIINPSFKPAYVFIFGDDRLLFFFLFLVVDVQEKILPGVTHWQSPNYFAYFPSNSSIAGFLGEMLSAGLNIVGFSWITSPAATELETVVLDWLAKALLLPHDFFSTGKVLDNNFYEFG